MEFLTSFLGRNGYLPHGYCFTWTPGLLWAMVTADSVIAAAYFSIPLAMVSFFRRRPEPSLRWVAWLFIVFIFACGLTHVMDVWTIWRPDYGVQALTKVVTAMASLVTAVVLWFMIPRALKIPSVEQLRSVIASLEAEIGKRRSAEDRLHDLQQNLAITLSSIGAGFIATDRDGCITRMNGVAEQVTGWSQPQALGQGIRQVFVQEGVQEGRPVDDAQGNPVDEMMAQGTTVDTVVHVVGLSRSGQRTPLEVRAALTHADDGTVRGIAMVFRDMSRIEQAEAESSRLGSSQRQAEAALRNSEARLRFTLESAQIGDWDLDLATGVSTRSMRHDRCFGYDTEQAEWSFDRFIQHVHPQERAAVMRRFHLAADHQEDWRDECRVVWPDGSVHWISVTGSVLLEGGKASRMLGIVVDITEQKMAEQTRLTAQRLEAENREIQAASRLKSQFLANMSHELRTPLNAIIGFADLLHSGAVPVESPKNREFLGHIGTSGRHLLQLINDVLDLSKVESGKFEFFPEPVNLVSLVNEANDILHTSIQRKSLAVSVDIDPTLTDIVVDAGRLKQALYNYLSNAIKFTPESGWVAVRASAEGPAHFRIEVEDNGIGISEADMARLFTEFQQLDAGYGKQHPGTGLGLALTRKLVQAQGGSVGVRSTEGVGSVFHLVLARVPTVVSTQGLPDVATELAQHRLLVIEDERHAQALLVEALSESGFQVDAAGTGQQAVAQASVKAYDGITLDLQMPDQRGLGVLASIRSHGPSRESPVVGMTVPAQAGGSASFAIANVLCKPIRSEEVALAMTRFNLGQAGGGRVMVIDDDPLSLDVMRATLANIGIEAVCVADGRTALRDIDKHRPDAIVLDLMMPEFDGFAVLDVLRQLPKWRETPVFIWTSMLLTEEEYASLSRSAQLILSKGGGALASMLEGLRQWRPPVSAVSSDGGGA